MQHAKREKRVNAKAQCRHTRTRRRTRARANAHARMQPFDNVRGIVDSQRVSLTANAVFVPSVHTHSYKIVCMAGRVACESPRKTTHWCEVHFSPSPSHLLASVAWLTAWRRIPHQEITLQLSLTITTTAAATTIAWKRRAVAMLACTRAAVRAHTDKPALRSTRRPAWQWTAALRQPRLQRHRRRGCPRCRAAAAAAAAAGGGGGTGGGGDTTGSAVVCVSADDGEWRGGDSGGSGWGRAEHEVATVWGIRTALATPRPSAGDSALCLRQAAAKEAEVRAEPIVDVGAQPVDARAVAEHGTVPAVL